MELPYFFWGVVRTIWRVVIILSLMQNKDGSSSKQIWVSNWQIKFSAVDRKSFLNLKLAKLKRKVIRIFWWLCQKVIHWVFCRLASLYTSTLSFSLLSLNLKVFYGMKIVPTIGSVLNYNYYYPGPIGLPHHLIVWRSGCREDHYCWSSNHSWLLLRTLSSHLTSY